MDFTGSHWTDRRVVGSGQLAIVELAHGGPVAVSAVCAVGASATVQYTLDDLDDSPAWFTLGTVALAQQGEFTRLAPARGIRINATGGAVTATVLQARKP